MFRGDRSEHQAKFVSDVNLPDRATVKPNESLTKVWKVQNTGETAWPAGTKLVSIGRAHIPQNFTLDAEEFDVPLAKPGEIVDVVARMKAPSADKKDTPLFALFRLVADRAPFGDKLWIDVRLGDAEVVPSPPVQQPAPQTPVPVVKPVEQPAPTPVGPVVTPKPAVVETKATPAAPKEVPFAGDAHPMVIQLRALHNMGFTNLELNTYLLQQNNGNVQKVCDFLLNALQ